MIPAGQDNQRRARLKQRAENVVERLAAEQHRIRRFRRAQLWVNILFAAAVIATGAGAAMEYVLLKDLARDIKAVQTRVDSSNAALDRIVRMIEHNEEISQKREAVLTGALAALRTSLLLPRVDIYLSHLEATGEWQFNDAAEKAEISRRLKSRIGPAIVAEIEARPEIPDAQVWRQIEQLVDRNLQAEGAERDK